MSKKKPFDHLTPVERFAKTNLDQLSAFLDSLTPPDLLNFRMFIHLPTADTAIGKLPAGRYKDMAVYARLLLKHENKVGAK